MPELTFDDVNSRIRMDDLLLDAGYVRNRRDGLRYPAYIRLDGDGRRIPGDKFLVTHERFCFQPPQQKVYNIVSFIKEHPHLFRDYHEGMNPDLLVFRVAGRLLGSTVQDRPDHVATTLERPPFSLESYDLLRMDPKDRLSARPFFPYFRHRRIDLMTQRAFCDSFFLAGRKDTEGRVRLRNLSFPLTIPGGDDSIVGLEQRGRMRKDGVKPFRGKAENSNGSEGLWTASPGGSTLERTLDVYLFESAYDAMAYYQLHRREDSLLKEAVFVSTGGTPTVSQMQGLIRSASHASFHLCFDNDMAGLQFAENFRSVAAREKPYSEVALAYRNTPGNVEVNDDKEQAFDRLPEDIRQRYYSAYSKMEEAVTAFLCPEDRQELREQAEKEMHEFRRMVDESIIEIDRILPGEGYKDFNEELIALCEQTEKRAVGSDFDGDGQVETEESDEEKHTRRR